MWPQVINLSASQLVSLLLYIGLALQALVPTTGRPQAQAQLGNGDLRGSGRQDPHSQQWQCHFVTYSHGHILLVLGLLPICYSAFKRAHVCAEPICILHVPEQLNCLTSSLAH